jgi:transketolase
MKKYQNMNKKFQRDIFIDEIYEEAKKNKNIIFISADFGAPSLDKFRENLPKQFIHPGISEQHMIDLAAGLSLSGKKVYIYAMAPFITLRCLEQIKCSLAMMQLPVTIIAVGVGLGYADAGPTHYLTEDIACMRSIVGMEVCSASDEQTTRYLARETINNSKLRIIRLERHALRSLHSMNSTFKGLGYGKLFEGNEIVVLSYGHLLHRAFEVVKNLNKEKHSIGLIDVYYIKPLSNLLLEEIKKYKVVITYEEQCLSGGFGSSIIEMISDANLGLRTIRLGLPDKYYFENGGREYLLDKHNLSKDNLKEKILSLKT